MPARVSEQVDNFFAQNGNAVMLRLMRQSKILGFAFIFSCRYIDKTCGICIIVKTMSGEICVQAPAKINLGLRVLPKREDGFHNIESVFATVALSDSLIVRPLAEANACKVFCRQADIPQKNTINSAYQAAKSVLGADLPGISVELEKRIPLGGGLGGGSSDAAALLFALRKLGVAFSAEEANQMAALVGSDVFFFLSLDGKPCGAAIVSGRGELVKPISPRSDLHYVLVFPGVHSSTAEAYAAIDESVGKPKNECLSLDELESVYRRPAEDWTFENDFTPVIAGKHPKVRQALCDVKSSGALFCDMSGSGSTVFGVFDSAKQAQDAERCLSGKWNALYCKK